MINERLTKIIIATLSIVVFTTVVILNRKIIAPPLQIPDFVYHLPKLNALLNSIAFILLMISLIAIKKKKIKTHQTLNLTAFVISAVFLISYVVAHYYLPETIYGDANHNGILENDELKNVGFFRVLYLLILLTHILFAAVSFPLVLLAFYYGINNNISRHKKIVRWAYPLWLYVCFTGPIVYLFLRPYYDF